MSTRIAVCFLALILVTVGLLATLTVHLYSQQLRQEMDNVLLRKLSLIDITLSKKLDRVQSTHFSIIGNPDVLSLLERSDVENGLSEDDQSRLNHILSLYSDNEALIRSIFAIDANQRVLQPFYAFYADQVLHDPAYRRLTSSELTRVFGAPNHFPLLSNVENTFVAYYGKIYDNRSQYRTLGTLMIQIKRDYLFLELEPLLRDSFSLCLVVDESAAVVASLGERGKDVGLTSAALNGETSYQGERYRAYSSAVSSYPGWRVLCLQTEEAFAGKLTVLKQMATWITTALAALVIVTSFLLSSMITRPLLRLREAMCQLGVASRTEQWPEPISVGTRDEIFDLVSGFNEMNTSLHRLMDENRAQQEKEKAMELASLQMELDMLQLQINPHFIHNTLNTMHYMALESGAKELGSMIAAFNALLRNNFAQSGPRITTLEEVANLQNYLLIQQHRYDFPIRFQHDVEPELSFAMLPRLILQPLVENALFHGLVPAHGGGITVTMRRAAEEEQMEICVADDGVGIPAEMLERLSRGEFTSPKRYNAFGMKNVNERLHLLYGRQSCLHIQNAVGGGTVIRFRIPIELKF